MRKLFQRISRLFKPSGTEHDTAPDPAVSTATPPPTDDTQSKRDTGTGTAPKKGRGRRRRRRSRSSSNAGGNNSVNKQQNDPDEIDTDESDAEPKRKRWSLREFEVPVEEGKTRFHDFKLPLGLMHAIADLGFQYCTPIQAQILPDILQGRDAVGQAQTGTGKTAAFLTTIITTLWNKRLTEKPPAGSPRALILAPTRELVVQISKEALDLGKYTRLKTVAVYGGMDYRKQEMELGKRVDIIVATPGRLLDFERKQVVNLGRTEILVLDEADRMLDMGFIPDVRRIVYSTPHKSKRQTLFFSATFPSEVKRLAEQWTHDPVSITVEAEQVAADTVEQIVYIVTGEEKYTLLYNLITQKNLQRLIVFTNRRDETRRLTARLRKHKISCAELSGDVPQAKRSKTLDDFREGKIRVLVATDVAGRGLHVDGISHVVNYNLPTDPEDYVHRIGRTGRAGETGISISFACEEDSFQIPAIQEFLGKPLSSIYPEEALLEAVPQSREI